jgi:hypothetical protein
LEPEILRGRFGEKKSPASNDLNKNLDFKAFNGADLVKFEHFLSPGFCLFHKLSLIFLDIDHASGLQERLKGHFVRILELEKRPFEIL